MALRLNIKGAVNTPKILKYLLIFVNPLIGVNIEMTKKQELAENSLIQRNETKFLASALGEEIVMMNTDNGDYIGVNSVGSDIWNLLTEPMTVNQLTDKITELYEVGADDAKKEVDEFVARMLKQDMILVS